MKEQIRLSGRIVRFTGKKQNMKVLKEKQQQQQRNNFSESITSILKFSRVKIMIFRSLKY